MLNLDAVTIVTDKTFDCVYSNKALHHLTRSDLRRSFLRQKDILNGGGLLKHIFWYGSKEEVHNVLRFVYYKKSMARWI